MDQTPAPAESRLAAKAPERTSLDGFSPIPVVGIGGSAGAIPALGRFLEGVTVPSGLVYVVILHLSADHESTLAELLQRHTTMPVVQVRESVDVERDTVYVIPPGRALGMRDGRLEVGELPRAQPRHVAVDLFFRTLAESHGSHATAIVLSGLDGDGAVGIKRIKERGGLTIAQDLDEAEYSGMPRSAIATGMVDWVLPVAEMGRRVARYVASESHLRLPDVGMEGGAPAGSQQAPAEQELRDVLNLLRARTGRDFSRYKRATIIRRIGRRMQVNEVQDFGDYVGCLRTRPGEAEALLQDLLISVTNFFRDPECFAALERQIPALFEGKAANGALRAWVVACATGEEAYSIAMLLAEHAARLPVAPTVQVFATDLDEQAIRVAREGVYPPSIAADVSDERLRRFFTREHRGYRVRRELREQVLFAAHDALCDVPFSGLDLISCRNLLIYLDRDAQRRLLETVHFALLPTGRLFLGASETVDDDSALLVTLDKKNRIYAPRPLPHANVAGPPGRPLSWTELHFRMLELLAPPSIVVDGQHDIVHLSPNAGRFLQFTEGEPSRNLLRAMHPSLRIELRGALYQAEQRQSRVDVAALSVMMDGQALSVRMSVLPMGDLSPGFLLVTLEVVREGGAATPVPVVGSNNEPLTQLLDRELERLKSHLRDTVEQYEASTEELKASNEELQAMNEELRSATEELETSREELQSINEELTTVNQELKAKVDELGHANSDIQNLMDATAIATVFLDRALRITRYTPSAVELFNLIPSDLGRPLSDLSNRVNYPDLEADAQRVLQGLVPITREVADSRGNAFLARALPYRVGEDRIAGVVLTLVDITERKRHQEALRLSEQRFDAVADKAAVGLLELSERGVVTYANEAARKLMGDHEGGFVGVPVSALVHADDRAEFEQRFASLPVAGSFDVDRRVADRDGQVRWVHDSVSWLPAQAGRHAAALVVSVDISERRATEDALRASEERLRLVVDNATEYAIFSIDRDLVVTSWNAGAQRLLGWSADEILGQRYDVLFTENERAQDIPRRHAETALSAGWAADERALQRKSGETFWASGAMMPMRDHRGEVVGFVKILRDQTADRRSRDELARSQAELVEALSQNEHVRAALQAADLAKDRFLAVLSHELRNPLASIANATDALQAASRMTPVDRGRAQLTLRSQVEAMRALLDDLLDVSRLRFGRLALNKHEVTLRSLVDRALDTARALIDRRRHTLTIRLPDEEIRLEVDPTRMGQVLSNLLINAAKYTDEGGRIELRARVQDDQCRIEVADNGKGLDEAARRSMFEMFWRASEVDIGSAQGMGIGLAVARSVVQMHDGTITAESAGPGTGTTVVITLPLGGPAAPAAPADAKVATGPAQPHVARHRRVVVADDIEDVAWALSAALKAWGHDVETVADGAGLLALVERDKPEVAIIDLGMPGFSGHDVAERLRATEHGRGMLLVAVTGWGGEGDRERSLKAGFDAHLVKPVSVEALCALIDDWNP
jgi:two-component system CheB/CheR fusion protein